MKIKKLAIPLLSVCLVVLFSCSNGYEEQILGKWVLENYEFQNFDVVCKKLSEIKIEQINEQVSILDEKINKETDVDLRENLQERRRQISESKNKYIVDSVKLLLDEQRKNIEGKVSYTFKSDSSFVVQGVSNIEIPSAKWKVIGDSLITYVEGQPFDIYKIEKLEGNQMVISCEIFDGGVNLQTNLIMRKK